MASYNYGHSFPRVFIGTGAFATSGNTTDLTPGEIGIFDKTTFDALDMGAAIPAAYHKRQIMFAQGAYHTKDSLTSGNLSDNFQDLQKSIKSLGVLTKYVNSVTKTEPQRATAESWVIGWDGFSDCCATPKCDSTYTVRLDAKGEVIRRLLNRDWYKELSYQTECCEGCVTCSDGVTSKFAMFNSMAKQINEDPIASKFLKASLMYDSTTCPRTTIGYTEFEVDVCDAGDILSLAKIQVEYPTLNISRTKRDGEDVTTLGDQTKGSTSTYTACIIDVPITALTNTVATAAATVAAAVDTRYEVDATAAVEITLPAAGTPGDTIEVVHSAGTASNITFVNATGTVIVPTDGGLKFVDDGADWIGTVLSLPVDTVAGEVWTVGADKVKEVRTLFITVNKDEGDAVGRLAEVQAFYANRTDLVAATDIIQNATFALTAADCTQVLTLSQTSIDCVDPEACKSQDISTFAEITSFEGIDWVETEPCDTTADCDTCIGLKIEAAFVEKKFGDCSFNSNDYYNVDGIRLEVSLKDDAALCSHDEWPVRKLSSFTQATGLGETVLRKYITASGYDLPEEQFEMDLRMREVADQQFLNVVDRNAYYVKYTLNHSIPHSMNAMGMTGLNNDQTYNLDFYFEEGITTTDFEARLTEIAVEAGLDNAAALFTY